MLVCMPAYVHIHVPSSLCKSTHEILYAAVNRPPTEAGDCRWMLTLLKLEGATLRHQPNGAPSQLSFESNMHFVSFHPYAQGSAHILVSYT
jgi:hypothetical protein